MDCSCVLEYPVVSANKLLDRQLQELECVEERKGRLSDCSQAYPRLKLR
jgi:hypothetical protein